MCLQVLWNFALIWLLSNPVLFGRASRLLQKFHVDNYWHPSLIPSIFLVMIKFITKYCWYVIDVKSYSLTMIIFKYMITNVIILKPLPVLLYKITVHCIHGIFIVFWCSSQTQIVSWITIWDWSKSMTTEEVGGCVFWRVCVCIHIDYRACETVN